MENKIMSGSSCASAHPVSPFILGVSKDVWFGGIAMSDI